MHCVDDARATRNALIDREPTRGPAKTRETHVIKAKGCVPRARLGIAAGLAPARAKPIMTFGAVCRASMLRNYLSSLPGLIGLRMFARAVCPPYGSD